MSKINFLHGYVKFKEEDTEWNKITAPTLWIEGDYNELDRIIKSQNIFAYLLELIPCPATITPPAQAKISYIEKGE